MEPVLSPIAREVLRTRYLVKDAQGQPREDPAGMFRRVADRVARAELEFGSRRTARAWAESFYELMASLAFLPNSPTLMNAGRRLGQLSACFVLPVADSIQSIFGSLRQAALIQKSGGGTGFNFSNIRPAGDVVASTHGVSSGPLSFLRIYDLATDTIKQGGTRRGANMGLLRVSHPDILEFIRAKLKPGLGNFNLSVIIPDDFMAALDRGGEVALINPRHGRAVGRLAARAIFDELVAAAHACGEPGAVFIDRINQGNPTPLLGAIEATNPCGEQPLLAYESCNLGSINLAAAAEPDGVDWTRLGRIVDEAVRFLDDVISVNRYPLPRIRRMTLANRKIGLGVMGFADLLITLGVPYTSQAAVEMAEEIMSFIRERARRASVELGLERGSFPNFKGSVYEGRWPAMRNATQTTIAPTGTLSLIAGVSSGIEPLFALALQRQVLEGRYSSQIQPSFLAALKKAGADGPEVVREVARQGRAGRVAGVPEEVRRLFVTAHEVDWSWHLKIQAAFQRHTDNAVSKTINMAEEATSGDVAEAIRTAFELGLKGLTLYRHLSRPDQVLSPGLETSDWPGCAWDDGCGSC